MNDRPGGRLDNVILDLISRIELLEDRCEGLIVFRDAMKKRVDDLEDHNNFQEQMAEQRKRDSHQRFK